PARPRGGDPAALGAGRARDAQRLRPPALRGLGRSGRRARGRGGHRARVVLPDRQQDPADRVLPAGQRPRARPRHGARRARARAGARLTRRARLWLFAPALAGLMALLVWGLTGLPHFGHYRGPYGKVLAKVAVPERRATDIVSSVTFDYRGFDTLGEEIILFTAALGLVVLLREQRGEEQEPEGEEGEEDRDPP